MRKLSSWARSHPWKSRVLIVLGHLCLFILACFIGINLPASVSPVIKFLLYLSAAGFTLLWFLYPVKGEKQTLPKNTFYIRQKIMDFLVGLSFFIMILSLVSSSTQTPDYMGTDVYGLARTPALIKKEKPTAREILASLQYRDKHSLTKTEKRILKKEFKRQLGIYAKAKISGDKEASGNAGLMILAIIAAVGLLFLLVGLACSLSCNGYDGAAIAVALLGTAGIIIGLIYLIKRIKRGPRKKQEVIIATPA